MKTVWYAIGKRENKIRGHQSVEAARNTVFEWAKNYLFEINADLPEVERFSEEHLMEEANEEVIQAEETPWLGRYTIKEVVIED